MKNQDRIVIVTVGIGVMLLFLLNLFIGSVSIDPSAILNLLTGGESENPAWPYIVENRLHRSLVAIFGGGALAVAGLILQVFFRNPLAGPGVLGISSGASLGVAIVILGGMSFAGSAGIIVFGVLGAFSVLALVLFLSRFIKSQVTLLVIGLMIGYFTSAFVNMLFLWAGESETREFVIWGLGSFEGLNREDLTLFIGVITAALLSTVFMIKGMNGYALGEDYARSMGINVRLQRTLMILITSVLAAVVTVYCGPVSFIGIAVPQLVRLLSKSKNHAFIIPFCFLGGAFLAILSDITVRLTTNSLPLNTVTALVGAPVIIWTILKMNKRNVEM
ncbi:MAG: iron ABC transporter permease [Crocinitomicaceae bacterium]|nr:iron ABC transporter permease [Crocinitomicaceae bacterium]